MNTTHPEDPGLSPIEFLRDPDVVAALLKPPRLALLAALREPDSASGLARRLELPRQRLNHHLRELEQLGVIELVEERQRGNFTERVLRATARRYLICPSLLGDLGTFGPEDFRDPHAWVSLAAVSIQALSHLESMRATDNVEPLTLTVPSLLRFASTEALNDFTLELTGELGRLVRKYHDETSEAAYWFVLGAYPVIAGSEDQGG